jgi:hypothetical protein
MMMHMVGVCWVRYSGTEVKWWKLLRRLGLIHHQQKEEQAFSCCTMGAAQLMTSSNQQQESLKLQMFHYGFPENEFRAHKSVPSSSQEMNSQLTKKCSTMLPKK